MKQRIKQQIEPNYNMSRSGTEYTEVIFETNNGELYKGSRPTSENPKTTRAKFLKWLKGESEDRYEFEEIETIKWNYDSAYTVSFDSKGVQTR